MTTTGHNSLTPDLLKQTVAKNKNGAFAPFDGLMYHLLPTDLRHRVNWDDTCFYQHNQVFSTYHALMETYRAALGDFVSTELGKAGVPR